MRLFHLKVIREAHFRRTTAFTQELGSRVEGEWPDTVVATRAAMVTSQTVILPYSTPYNSLQDLGEVAMREEICSRLLETVAVPKSLSRGSVVGTFGRNCDLKPGSLRHAAKMIF